MSPPRRPDPTRLPAVDDPHPPYGRTAHPYFLHDMILAQPEAIRRTAESAWVGARAIPTPSPDRPLLFVGQGTSFHAALGGAVAARAMLGPHALVRAVPSFDLLLEPELIAAARCAVVFSASGETALTLQAQEALAAAQVRQILITGSPHSPSGALAEHTLATQGSEERAWTHTVSFTTALVAAYALCVAWANAGPEELLELHRVASALVDREEEWRAMAEALADRTRWLLLGSGAAEVTAREAALKLREGAGRFVATAGVEEFLHGTLPSVDESTAVVSLATEAFDLARSRHAAVAAALAGARSAVLAPIDAPAQPGEHPVPSVPPFLSPAVQIIPLQFVTYWTAVREGRNPDVMGYDVPRIWAARRSFGI